MGVTPKMDGSFHGKSNRSKWMMTGGTPMDWKPPYGNLNDQLGGFFGTDLLLQIPTGVSDTDLYAFLVWLTTGRWNGVLN